MFMLAVDVRQPAPRLLQGLHGHWMIIDKATGAALAGDDPADDAFLLGIDTLFGEPRQEGGKGADVETDADFGALATMTHRTAVRPVPQGQAQGVHQNGFAGAGLAGQGGHAGGEFQFHLVDDGEVADVKVGEHE